MNTTISKESLSAWIKELKETAKQDTTISIAWFPGTVESPYSIIAGWQKIFTNDNFSDLFCTSKSQPEYAMCIKVAINDGPYAYTDFEVMNMPLDKTGDIDDTCVPLEWDDDPEAAAMFFMHEWERIMKEHGKEI